MFFSHFSLIPILFYLFALFSEIYSTTDEISIARREEVFDLRIIPDDYVKISTLSISNEEETYRFLEHHEKTPSLREIHTLVFVIRQKNLDKLDEMVMEVSAPRFSRPQMTREEVISYFSVPESAEHVKEFLRKEGVSDISSASTHDFITARAEIGLWMRILRTSFHYVEVRHPHKQRNSHQSSISHVIRAKECFLPRHVIEHLSEVHYTTQVDPLDQRPMFHSSFHAYIM
jgi:hypothetical protein